jgi:(1->4)-alpha-D-glucan 1-alpha-D-glucosylmutase
MPELAGNLAPTSTYRVQFRPGFGFHEGAELAEYLSALGVGALYASPHFQSGPGSTH